MHYKEISKCDLKIRDLFPLLNIKHFILADIKVSHEELHHADMNNRDIELK